MKSNAIKTFLTLTLLFVVLLAFGQDSTAVEPVVKTGFWAFYNKYATAIWMVLGSLGVSGFLAYRAAKVKAALDEIILAGEDSHYTEEEFQKILKAIKAVFGKKDA